VHANFSATDIEVCFQQCYTTGLSFKLNYEGKVIPVRLSNLCVTRFYTLASTIPMLVVGHDARLLRSTSGENLYYRTNSLEMGGGEANDVILETAQVTPGTYLLYTTNLNYLSNNKEDFGGMMAEIVIE